MAVLRYDFHSHPKLIGLSNSAIGIYARMLSYASANLTDGFVPDVYVRQIADKRRAFASLLSAGVLVECHEGFLLRDYLDYNPSKTEVEKKRRESRERASRSRGGKSQQSTRAPDEDVRAYVRDIGKDKPFKEPKSGSSTDRTEDAWWDGDGHRSGGWERQHPDDIPF